MRFKSSHCGAGAQQESRGYTCHEGGAKDDEVAFFSASHAKLCTHEHASSLASDGV